MRVLDLFSGIGGFSLGLERTGGFETVAFCDTDPFCRKVLRKHWPDVPIFEDVRTLEAEHVGPVDVVCGGYPCQPFSVAGKRGGAEDDRHVWPEMHRLVASLRPAWVIGENVAGHVSMGLDDVLSDLEALGYASRPFVLPAVAVDARHRRDRVWVVAYAERAERGQERGSCDRLAVASDSISQRAESPSRAGVGSEAVDDASLRRHGAPTPEMRSRRDASEHASRWLPEPDVGRVAHGVPRRVDRLRALGNAVVPQIPELIGRAILAAQEERTTALAAE